MFQAQFRSSLTCPTCERQSNTFDPFLCVSLPIPQKQLLPVFVNVLYIDQSPRQVKIGLTVGVHETIAELRKVLSKDTGIAEPQTLLCQIDPVKGFQRTLRDSQPVTVLKECGGGSHPLYCVEVPKHKESSEDDGAFVVLTWTNVLKEGPIEKRFGSPYSIQVSRETLYSDLQKLLMKEMASILHEDILISAQKVPLFKIRVLDGFEESVSYLDSTVDLPMYTEAVEQAINLCTLEPGGGPAHVKLILEWDAPAKSQIIADDRDVVEEHSSVKEVEKSPDEATVVTLQECFSLYTSAEKLGQGDAWLCPACNRKQEVVKRMGLWSVPDVLVVHLKRFRQSNSSTNKLTTMVDFPLEGFDMSPNVTKSPGSSSGNSTSSTESTTTTNSHLKMFNALSPWKHPKRFPQTRSDEDYTYELYAVCNHHGSDLQGGHYTAFCKNPTDGQWYCFDDMHTKPITEQEVLSQDAYILFYQRQSLGAGSGSSASSSSSSGSSTNPEHWVFRMPDFNYKKKVGTGTTGTTASTTTTTTTAASAKTVAAAKSTKVANQSQVSASECKTSSKAGLSDSKDTKDYEKSKETKEKAEDKTETSSFVRNSAKYATLPTKRTSDIIECDVDHHSDIEPGSPDEEDFEEEDEIAIEKQKHKEEEKRAKEKAKAIEEADEDEDDVSRPIDKNDVD